MGAQNAAELEQPDVMNNPGLQRVSQPLESIEQYGQFVKKNAKLYKIDVLILEFTLSHCKLNESNFQRLLQCIKKTTLDKEQQKKQSLKFKLFLIGNRLGGIEIAQLVKASLVNLQELHLTKNLIGDQACLMLSKGHWPVLFLLALDENNVTEKGCKFLSRKQWPTLTGIILCQNGIGQKGIRHLVKARWPSLQWIKVRQTTIGDRGCALIPKSNCLKMKGFVIQANGITDKGCQALLKSNFNKLEIVDYDRNPVTQFSVNFLRDKFPNCFKMYFERESDIFY